MFFAVTQTLLFLVFNYYLILTLHSYDIIWISEIEKYQIYAKLFITYIAHIFKSNETIEWRETN